jgi:hypothetical protein
MVERSDKVVHMGGFCEEVLDKRRKGWADEFAFEADDDVDLGGVDFLEAAGFEDVGVVAGREDAEGGLGVVELRNGLVFGCSYEDIVVEWL